MNKLEGNLVVLESLNRLQRKFVIEAIEEWDREGEGEFGRWVSEYVMKKMIE